MQKITRRNFVTSAVAASAVAGAAIAAGCSTQKTESAEPAVEESTTEVASKDFDVVIIGAGGAGLAAAVAASDLGANVAVLDKMIVAGGNTSAAEGGMNACGTKWQKAYVSDDYPDGIEDTVDLFFNDTMEGGYQLNDPELVEYMCENSNETLEWLESLGVTLNKIGRSGGQSVPRVHRPESGESAGQFIINGLSAAAGEKGLQEFFRTKATSFVQDENGAVAGVVCEDADGNEVTFNAKAVVLATGGFGANPEMVVEYNPELEGYITTNVDAAQGDGVIMAKAINAGFRDMEQIQIHPTCEQSTRTLVSEGLRGDGAILVNENGERFVNELLTRDVVSQFELEQPNKHAYEIFDQYVADENTAVEEKYVPREIVKVADSIAELAGMIGVDEDALVATIEGYNADIDAGADDAQGRTASLRPVVTAPFYAVDVAPAIHHTMGGVTINVDNEVLDSDGNVIPGLFAAGEVTGGVHGGNRLGGNAICDIAVYGRNSGNNASAYAGL